MGGFVIDGYAPDSQNFRNIDWKGLEEKKLLASRRFTPNKRTYRQYTGRKSDIPTENKLLKNFSNTVLELREYFCPFEQEKSGFRRQVSERHRVGNKHSKYLYMAGSADCYNYFNRIILNRMCSKHPYGRKPILPILSCLEHEIKADISKGLERYVMNLILFPNAPTEKCAKLEECCQHWIDILDFKIKEKNQYTNFNSFQQAVEALILYYFDHPGFHITLNRMITP